MTEWKESRIKSDDYGPGTPCSHCGHTLDKYCPEWSEYCLRHCELRPKPIVKELEQLADEWEDAEETIKTDETIDAPGYARALSKANSELREVLADYE